MKTILLTSLVANLLLMSVSNASDLSVRFTPLSDQLIVGDFLFVNVTVTNLGKHPLEFDEPQSGVNFDCSIAVLAPILRSVRAVPAPTKVQIGAVPAPIKRYQGGLDRGFNKKTDHTLEGSGKRWILQSGETKSRVVLVNPWSRESIHWALEMDFEDEQRLAFINYGLKGKYKTQVLTHAPFAQKLVVSGFILQHDHLRELYSKTGGRFAPLRAIPNDGLLPFAGEKASTIARGVADFAKPSNIRFNCKLYLLAKSCREMGLSKEQLDEQIHRHLAPTRLELRDWYLQRIDDEYRSARRADSVPPTLN